MKCCDHDSRLPFGTRTFSRRDLFSLLAKGAGAAIATPSVLSLLARHALAQGSLKKSGGKKLILLWLEGGPSQLDTFDPKPGAATGGPFKALGTDVRGWSFSEALPGLAKRADQLAVVRSMTSKEGNHSRARLLVHCGYVPNPTVAFPTLGSLVANEIGDLEHELPAFVQVSGAPGSGGYLGVKAAPFVINDPNGRIENLAYAGGVDSRRLDHRDDMVDVLDSEFARRGAQPAVASNRDQRERARKLMDSKLLTAFDLDAEKDAVRDAYGRGEFGQGVLLARRLLEHGVTAVEVVLNGWDTHRENFKRVKELGAELDPAFSALVDDLKRRGLHDDVLVVCMGEFGRTPDIVGGDGRNHWPDNWCVALSGGGIKGGTVVGETDEVGRKIVSRPVQVADLFATLGVLLHLDRDKEFHAGKRPIKLIDPNGKPVQELMA